MRLGMFDFRKEKDEESADPSPVTVQDADESSSGPVSSSAWSDEDFGALSLDDLEAALAVETDEDGDDLDALLGNLAGDSEMAGLLEALGEEQEHPADPASDDDLLAAAIEMVGEEDISDLELVGASDLHTGEVPDTPIDAPPGVEGEADGESAVSGVVTDEIVLALLHEGTLRVTDVYEALRGADADVPLWRTLLAIEGADHGAILDQVARHRGYESVTIGEGAAVDSLAANMGEQLGEEAMDRVLDLGAVPVELSIDPETLAYRLVIAAVDPAHPRLNDTLSGLTMEWELRYAPLEQIAAALQTLNRTLDPAESLVVSDPADPSSGHTPTRDLPAGRHDMPARRLDRDAVSRSEENDPKRRVSWPKDEAENEAEEAALALPGEETLAGEDSAPAISEEEAAANLDRIDRRARKDRVVAALIRAGRCTVDLVNKAYEQHAAEGSREAIWRVLADLDGVDREVVFTEAARVYAFPEVAIAPGQPDAEFVMLIMETIAEDRRDELLSMNLLPFEYAIDAETGGARLIFITHDPARSDVHRILAQLKLGRFELRYASEKGIAQVIEEVFPKRNEYLDRIDDNQQAYDLGTEFDEKEGLVDESALEAEMSRSGLINLFEATLVEAVRSGVSDVHIFPNPLRQTEIHFRVDGRLKRWHVEEKVHAESFLAVVKDNAMNIDRFERDAAQDGYIQRRVDDTLIRFRVSVLPIASANQEIRAESVVIRVLDDRKVLTDLAKLGMLEDSLERMNHAIRQPHGMVILTGPTGSGKSTTLVAALHQVITPEVNVLTIEDPVEYIIEGVRQIKLSHKLDLEQAIRAVLRHDPDIVMVGEMRDKATADLAIKLANTGHLTFSTLHTNDAPAAVSRLYKMGVEPFLIAYAINLVVAQRLIRGLCPNCKVEDANKDPVLMERLGFSEDEIDNLTIYAAGENKACHTCGGNGYKGRRAVVETLYFTQEIRHIIAESGEEIDEEQIRNQAIKDGMLTLQDSARELVKMGATSLNEMMRVTASE